MSEAGVWTRPAPSTIAARWHAVFDDPLVSLAALRAAGVRGLGEQAEDGGVVLRSVYWRAYHALLPAPTSLDLFPPALAAARREYDDARARYLVAPDGRWAADCTGADHWAGARVGGGGGAGGAGAGAEAGAEAGAGPRAEGGTERRAEARAEWDPLSLDGELTRQSPWKTWFAHVELRALIRQDVERTFPDVAYFTLDRVRRSVATALFVFSVLNPDVGYRQGMHELLAVCYLVVDRDSLERPGPAAPVLASPGAAQARERAMHATLDRRYVEHDAYALFAAVMRGAKAFYEWRAEEGPRLKPGVHAPHAPVIIRCNHIHSNLLRRIDPQLWERLETEGVEAQIWAIRWLRLIFTRELPYALAMRLWDGIFAEDPGLGLLDYVIVAMLLLIRNELIDAEYPTLLTHLLHYPAPSPAYPFSPALVVSQALYLRDNVSPAAGVHVVVQNQDVLGVKVARDAEAGLDGQPAQAQAHARAESSTRSPPGTAGRRNQVQNLAQGWFERAQAAGIDRAIMSTVNDLRKNLPDSATAYSYLPNLPFSPLSPPADRAAVSSIPSPSALSPRAWSTQPAGPSLAPAPRGRKSAQGSAGDGFSPRMQSDSNLSERSMRERDAERQVAELRLAMMGMGKAMGEWLDALNRGGPRASAGGGDTGAATAESADGIDLDLRRDPAKAWVGLARVRDALLEAAGSDVDDIVKEWGWHDGLETRAATPTPSTAIATQPAPAAASPASVGAALVPPVAAGTPPHLAPSTSPPPHVAVIPASPGPPVPLPRSDMSTASALVSASRPPLYLSTRHDRPATGIPRVPPAPARAQTRSAPLFPRSGSRPSEVTDSRMSGGQGPSSPPSERDGRGSGGDTRAGGAGDPLAGLGVSVRPTARAHAPIVDPLGVGH